ncbi:hypothetical protein L7F22_015578 [Adiantum nelumboides]|nr:hypothetical protein [Adiantum nelumboides]
MNEGQSATQFIDDWQKILDDGVIAGLAIPENLQSMLLLAALPPSWRAFITTQSSSTTDLQLQGLISKIIQENNLHQHGVSSTKPLTMVTTIKANSHRHQHKFGKSILPSLSYSTSPYRPFPQKNSNFQKNSPPYNPSYTCTFCNRTGHLERDCHTKRRTLPFNTTRPQAHLTTLEHPYTTLRLFATSLNTNVAFLKHKSETHSHFLTYQSLVENQLDHRIRAFRTDNGSEFTAHAFRNHCLAHGIQHQISIPHTPQQNGIVERKNRTLLNVARSMLIVSLPNQTPYFQWFGHTPYLLHTHIFGCDAYVVSTDPHRGKLDHKAISTIFVGYGERFVHKAYRLYDPIGRRFLFSRSVIFDELQLLKGNTAASSPTLSSPIDSIHAHDSTPFTKSSSIPLSQPSSNLLHNPSLPLLPLPSPSSSTNGSHNSTFELPTSPGLQASSSSDPLPTPSPPLRMMRSLADIYAQTNAISCTPHAEPKFPDPILVDDGVPLNEALSGPKAHLWKAAMDQEMAALHANKTWTLASLPHGRQPISFTLQA